MTEHQPCENPTGADNEQGSPTETDIAWTAGLFDGEGWIGMARQRRVNSRHLRYTAKAVVGTTSERTKDHLTALMRGMGVTPYVIERKAQPEANRRRSWNITTGSNIQTERFLTQIRPYLIEKHVQADLVLDYIAWRSSLPKVPPASRAGEVILGMKERAEQTMQMLSADRRRDDPSTTTRLAPTSGVMT